MTKMNKKNQVFASSEILGATLTANMSKSDISAFRKDPSSFIASSLNVDTGVVSLSMVENSADTINLALPYYSSLDSLSAELLEDGDVSSVSGGEVIIAIVTAITATAVGAVSALAVGGAIAIAADVQADEGLNLDGSEK